MRRSLLALLLLAAPAAAQRNAVVPPADPEAERRTFQVADGWEVSLFAADPLLAKPIQINFDPAGRLWVASSETYPQIEPGKPKNDKVLILEDRDGDGRADRTTVFADGLLIPTGVAAGDAGAYVADSTDLVHFSDPDPETGKARRKRVVLSGFGTEDTHHILHTFRWGPDGALYFNQSIYIHSHIETPHGVKRLNAGGIWQFRPDSNRLEVFARGFVNPWGTRFDKWGATFATDGAYGEGINYVPPGAAYFTAHNEPRIVAGLNPGSPKHCGLEILSGRGMPPGYDGSMITSDFRGHRVCRFSLRPDGSGYVSREEPELLKTTHPAFRPVDAVQGPDGAVYVADWYNPIIQHGEVDFRDPRRDKTHGRIWRVAPKGGLTPPRPKLVGASVAELLKALEAPEAWTRNMARRLLQEKGAEAVVPALEKWLASLDKGEIHEQTRLEGLWLYQSLDAVYPALLDRLLGSPDPRSRAAACRVAGAWRDRLPDVLPQLAPKATDPHPQVRLEAVRALALLGTREAAEAAAKAVDLPMDRWLDYSVWRTMRELAPAWLPDAQAGKTVFGGDPKRLIFALAAVGGDVAGPLKKLLRGGGLNDGQRDDVLFALAKFGGPEELGQVLVYGSLPRKSRDGGPEYPLIDAVLAEARARKVGPPKDVARVAAMAQAGTPAGLRLAGFWKLEAARADLMKWTADGPTPDVRRAALEGLASLGGAKSVEQLKQLAGDFTPPDRRQMAVIALAELDLRAAAHAAAPLLNTGPDPAALVAAFAARKGGSAALAAALGERRVTLNPDNAKVALRAARSSTPPDQKLLDAITAAGSLGAKKTWTRADVDALAADVAAKGDAARGEAVFRRAELQCLKCHAVAGAGGQVGPDMTSLGASAPVDYLVESLLLPNAKIKEGYHSQIVSTLDGKVVTGVKIREAGGATTLRDAEGREITIRADDVEGRKDGPSLMPDGLTDALTRGELLDLTKFLSMLGKVGGGYAASAGGVVRRWEAVQVDKELYTLTNRDRIGAVAKPGAPVQWAPWYSRVGGELPLTELPTFAPHKGGPVFAVARFRVDVTQPGPALLKLNDAAGVLLFLDGVPVAVGPDGVAELPLTAGARTVTLAVDTLVRAAPLKAELVEAPGSPARAAVAGGR